MISKGRELARELFRSGGMHSLICIHVIVWDLIACYAVLSKSTYAEWCLAIALVNIGLTLIYRVTTGRKLFYGFSS